MNGAEAIVRTLIGSGVDTCFTNPGTSEMHFVAALDQTPGMRCVLGLSESVVTGAADGYARMTDRPAATLLHCGPGLANGLANLHNARRARMPIVNIVGDQATYHRDLDPPLNSDTEGWAAPVSKWTRRSVSANAAARDCAEAVRAALSPARGIATLVLPSDAGWNSAAGPEAALTVPAAALVDEQTIQDVAAILRSSKDSILLLAGDALRLNALEQAARIAATTGAKLFAPSHNARIERGGDRPTVERIPYPIDQAVKALAGVKHIVLVGAAEPVAFFAYPGKPQKPAPTDAKIHTLAAPEANLLDALARLADTLGAPSVVRAVGVRAKAKPPSSSISSEAVARSIEALMPAGAVVVDESISFGRAFYSGTQNAEPHDWLQLTGGAIGSGIPLAIGAAIGAPGRRVINLQADGSALYTIQGLWTQARENLDVTTVILSNRKYAILLGELVNVGATGGKVALDMLSLDKPNMDWRMLAGGFGVEAAQADTMDRLNDLLLHSFRRSGPFLIELVLP